MPERLRVVESLVKGVDTVKIEFQLTQKLKRQDAYLRWSGETKLSKIKAALVNVKRSIDQLEVVRRKYSAGLSVPLRWDEIVQGEQTSRLSGAYEAEQRMFEAIKRMHPQHRPAHRPINTAEHQLLVSLAGLWERQTKLPTSGVQWTTFAVAALEACGSSNAAKRDLARRLTTARKRIAGTQ